MLEEVIAQLTWLVVRGSGISALVLLSLLLIGGIGHVTGWTYQVIAPVKAWIIHKYIAIAMAVLVVIHVGMLLFDSFSPFTLAEIAVPFLKTYSNKSTLFGLDLGYFAIPAGIVSLYIGAWVLVTSLTRLKTHKKLWLLSHWLSYGLIPLLAIHVLFSGTEFKTGVGRWVLIVLVVAMTAALMYRTSRRVKTSGQDK